jgi:uncharacterized protein YqhQ
LDGGGDAARCHGRCSTSSQLLVVVVAVAVMLLL